MPGSNLLPKCGPLLWSVYVRDGRGTMKITDEFENVPNKLKSDKKHLFTNRRFTARHGLQDLLVHPE